jgi:hypothetical protein
MALLGMHYYLYGFGMSSNGTGMTVWLKGRAGYRKECADSNRNLNSRKALPDSTAARRLTPERRAAVLLTTARHLERAAVDDNLDLFDQVAVKMVNRVGCEEDAERLSPLANAHINLLGHYEFASLLPYD